MTLTRRLATLALLPLSVLACLAAAAPWLRVFPAGVLVVPMLGAALLSVLLPVVVIAIGIRRLWLTALIDVLGFVFVTMLVTLRRPVAFDQLRDALVHGPSQILTFALPLVSPRTLLVAPVALCWLGGAVLGECIGRGWRSVVPYAALLTSFALAYAASVRGVGSSADGLRYDTLLAVGVLVSLLLLRCVGAWIGQDDAAEATQADGALPARTLLTGAAAALAIAAVTALVVQSTLFTGPPVTPRRSAPLQGTAPLSPLAFVAGLRPPNPAAAGARLFGVSVDRPVTPYVAIADLDSYDGDGWGFQRQFLPSGGVLPAEADPSLRPSTPAVTSRYEVAAGPLTRAPWMPFVQRPQRVEGLGVDIAADSAMIVPSRRLDAGQSYTVISQPAAAQLTALPGTSLAATSAPPVDTSLPGGIQAALTPVVASLQTETGTTGAAAVRALQAIATDLRTNYSLAGGLASAAASRAAAPASTDVPAAGDGTSLSAVLTAILGPQRAATPEQYATLMALVARRLGVPARIVTGFRLGGTDRGLLQPGTYDVTSAQAWTWVQVPISGQGWVVLDAAPVTYGRARPRPTSSGRPTASSTPTNTAGVLLSNPADRSGGNAVAPRSSTSDPGGTAVHVVLLAVLAALAVLVLALGALLAGRTLRRRQRRRAPDARRRVIGAWHEALDLLAEAGLPESATLTAHEVAELAAAQLGPRAGEALRRLGTAANTAIFSSVDVITAEGADAAWGALDDLRDAVHERLSALGRVRAALRVHRRPERRRGQRLVPRRR